MNNKFVLFCLLISPLSFASQPAPAAGAGAGLFAAAPAAAAQTQAAQVDIKQLQEQQKKDSARIAQLAAELEALKMQSNKDKEKPKQTLIASWNCKPSGKDEWLDKVTIRVEGTDKYFTITSTYYVTNESALGNGVNISEIIAVKNVLLNYLKNMADDEKLSLMNHAMNFKMTCILSGLLINKKSDALKGILNGKGSAVITI